MDELIESIRRGVAADASDEIRMTGANACRTILSTLAPEAVAAPQAANALPQIAAMLGALRGVPADQLLDLAIARLRAALPADAAPSSIKPLTFHLVPVTTGGRR